MKRRKIRIENAFETLKQECQDYSDSMEDLDERISYAVELDNCCNLRQLINTDIFAIACGKVVSISSKEIVLNEEF